MYIEKDGNRIHFEVYGDGQPLVILHPLATDHRAMKIWMEPMFDEIKGFKRIYIDIPGHGESGIAENVRTTDEVLSLVIDAIDYSVKDSIFSVVGMSFGGYIAQGILNKKKDQVKAISLLCPVVAKKERSLPERKVAKVEPEIFHNLDEDIATAFKTLMTHQTRENLGVFLQEFQPGRLLADRNFLLSEWRTLGYHYRFDLYPSETVYNQEALIITGRNDNICGYEDHIKLMDHFPNGTYAVLNDCGHMIQIEQRKKVTFLIGEWLKTIKD